VTRRNSSNPDGTPNDVDREFVAMFKIFKESESNYFSTNLGLFGNGSSSEEIEENSEFYTINGYVWANAQDFNMTTHDTVRWYFFTLGDDEDFHVAHWHGQTGGLSEGHRVNSVDFEPGISRIVDLRTFNPGNWLLVCNVEDHAEQGMNTIFHVTGSLQIPDQSS